MTATQQITIDIEELEKEETRLWNIVEAHKDGLTTATNEWYTVRRKLTDLRDQIRINDLVEAKIKEQSKEI
jgi:hypothetical protein